MTVHGDVNRGELERSATETSASGSASSTTDLIKSMALSSAELWHDVLQRLSELQATQVELAQAIAEIGVAVRSIPGATMPELQLPTVTRELVAGAETQLAAATEPSRRERHAALRAERLATRAAAKEQKAADRLAAKAAKESARLAAKAEKESRARHLRRAKHDVDALVDAGPVVESPVDLAPSKPSRRERHAALRAERLATRAAAKEQKAADRLEAKAAKESARLAAKAEKESRARHLRRAKHDVDALVDAGPVVESPVDLAPSKPSRRERHAALRAERLATRAAAKEQKAADKLAAKAAKDARKRGTGTEVSPVDHPVTAWPSAVDQPPPPPQVTPPPPVVLPPPPAAAPSAPQPIAYVPPAPKPNHFDVSGLDHVAVDQPAPVVPQALVYEPRSADPAPVPVTRPEPVAVYQPDPVMTQPVSVPEPVLVGAAAPRESSVSLATEILSNAPASTPAPASESVPLVISEDVTLISRNRKRRMQFRVR